MRLSEPSGVAAAAAGVMRDPNPKAHTVGRPGRGVPAAIAGLVFVASMLVVWQIGLLERDRRESLNRLLMHKELSAVRARVERELTALLHATSAVAGLARRIESLFDDAQAREVLTTILDHSRHLRHVAWAPDNVVRLVAPESSNQAVVGLDYRRLPDQWPAIQLAMNERRMVLVGPVDLVQGGRALIVRVPIDRRDGSYRGVLSLVIDIDSLLEAAGLRDSFAQAPSLGVRMRQRLGEPPVLIAGEVQAFADPDLIEQVQVPGGIWEIGIRPPRPDPGAWGGYSWLYLVGLIKSLALAGLVFLMVDRKRQAAWQARHDPLTGLPNRRRFTEVCTASLARRPESLAIVYLDLDGFKEVNDRHGHTLGDQVLRELAALIGAMPDTDVAARLGGDEFALLICRPMSDEELDRRLETLIEQLRIKAHRMVPDCPVSASAGVARYPADGRTLDELIAVADQRMYAAKAH
ncbi:MAG: diguanylate cyclase [Wenzhouxiangellaceae bacterium]